MGCSIDGHFRPEPGEAPVFGSIAEKVVKMVECPLLLLRLAKPESGVKPRHGVVVVNHESKREQNLNE